MEEEKVYQCDFCKQIINEDSDNFLIYGADDTAICYHCVLSLHEQSQTYAYDDTVEAVEESVEPETKPQRKIKPSMIKQYLDHYVIGQDKAKRMLSVAIYNHYKMIAIKHDYEKRGEKPPVELQKSCILLTGPTGSGKSYTIKSLAKELGVPFVSVDITSYTSAGYVGRDVETILSDLVAAANGNIAKAEQGIIFIDEVDKISKRGGTARTGVDPGHEGVQQALLKMVEGSHVELPSKKRALLDAGSNTTINTENILFVCGGAFDGIEKIIKKRLATTGKEVTGIGFNSKLEANNKKEYNDYILHIKTEDLKEYGMIPEFLGRFPVVCPLQELTEKELVTILTEPKNALVKQYQELFNKDNIALELSEEALLSVARQAKAYKTGARGLRSIMEQILSPVVYHIPDIEGVKEIYIDATTEDEEKTNYSVRLTLENNATNSFLLSELDKNKECMKG